MHCKDQQTYYVEKFQRTTKINKCTIWKNFSTTIFNTSTSAAICKIEKRILIYGKYARKLDQTNFDLFPDHTHTKIVIIPAIDSDFFRYQNDTFVYPARGNLEQLFYSENVNFNHLSLPNHKDFGSSN